MVSGIEFSFDPEFAETLVGKVVLAGVTFRNKLDEVTSLEQVYGSVERVDPMEGIYLCLMGARTGEEYWLPPVTNRFESATRGEYHLKSTGEVVKDPDWLIVWTVYPKDESPEDAGA